MILEVLPLKVLRGQYNLKLSFIGYQSVVIDKIRLQRGLRDMGVIELKVLSENIKEVVVRATPPSISYKVDKKVINAGSFGSFGSYGFTGEYPFSASRF